MARPLRIERAGGWYHVTGRGNERRSIFRSDQDRQHFCELLAEVVNRFRMRLHAYVLMDNHYHLVAQLTEANLSRAGQWLNVSYSVWFNRRHNRCGHLFQGRFKSVVVDPLQWGLELSRYVHLNPVRVRALGLGKTEQENLRVGATAPPDRGVVQERIAALRQYRWSSYRAYVGLAKQPEWLECDAILELGGGRKEEQRRNYRVYVESAVREGLATSPWEQLQDQVILGGQEFLEQLRGQVRGNAREQRGAGRLARTRPKVNEIIANLEKVRGELWSEIRDRHGDSGRDLVLYLGRRACGLKLVELAELMAMKDYGAVSAAIRRYEQRLNQSRRERNCLQQLCELSNIQM